MPHFPQNLQKSIPKAIFLDRDGTLNVDYGYVFDPRKIHPIAGAREALEIFQKNNFFLFLFTNQPGIGRKMYKLEDVEACNRRLFRLLGNPHFLEICIATETTHSPDNYRKPSPKFIDEMIGKYQLKRGECHMVGDKETDAFAGLNAEIKGILLESDYPRSPQCSELIGKGKISVFKDLLAFAKSIL
ncbi:MAG: HAD-IIIA family hydrolase [Puniceicoccales bacterium]|jgi:HAD superfamily hydrolase (TIGR01662 family)|nr:HAD-IIIA family hydrolase [Puniceicoccales bacterium]